MSRSPTATSNLVPLLPALEEERLRAFAEIGSDWFWEKDAELRFTYMSSAIDGPSSTFATHFLGKRIDEVKLPGFDEVDWRPLLRALDKRAPFRDFRFIRRTADGIKHLAVSGMPIFDGTGRFTGYRGTGRDLTKEMLAEERAAAAQSQLMAAIEAIPQCFLLLDASDRVVLCNTRYRELHAPIADRLVPGTTFEEICRAAAAAGLSEAAKGRIEAWLRERMSRHRVPNPEIEERQVGDRWFHITEQRTNNGGTVVIHTDITALKRRERELAEKTALLRATLENMEQGLLLLDASFRIKMWNDRWLDLHDVPRDLIGVGRPIEPVIEFAARRGDYGPGDAALLAARRIEQLRHPRGPVGQINSGTGRIVEVRRSTMPDGGVLLTFTDVTEAKQVETQLRRAKDEAEMASRSKTEFLANMSHELRTPLNAVIGFSDILIGQIFGPLGDSRYRDYARDIRDSGQHLLNLINDVLDVSKVEFGKVELLEETVDTMSIIEACIRLMRERAETAGIRLVQELPRALPQIQADSRRLKQILLNLLSNAVKFTPPGGRVTIRASEGANGLRLVIEDRGIGIAPADLEKALRPFGQIDSRLARKYQGTGLGLPLARSMTELHGGKLILESAPGRGTTATVWLPPSRILSPDGILPRIAVSDA